MNDFLIIEKGGLPRGGVPHQTTAYTHTHNNMREVHLQGTGGGNGGGKHNTYTQREAHLKALGTLHFAHLTGSAAQPVKRVSGNRTGAEHCGWESNVFKGTRGGKTKRSRDSSTRHQPPTSVVRHIGFGWVSESAAERAIVWSWTVQLDLPSADLREFCCAFLLLYAKIAR